MDLLINIDVDDLEKGIEFYRSALGLRLGRRLFDNQAAEMVGAACRIYLLTKKAGSPAWAGGAAQRDYGRHWTPVHIDFVVEDFESSLRQARGAGARLEGEPQERTWGRFVTLSDPFGHGLCLIQFRGRGYDEVAGEGVV